MQQRGRQLGQLAPIRLTPGPLFGVPALAEDQETSSWTRAVSPDLSVNRSALDRLRTGRTQS